LPGFGLADERLARLASDTTHFIHCAASVKLNMTLDEARATAVVPTRTMLELGRRAQRAGVLCKIDLVSTVGVWGRTPGHMPHPLLHSGSRTGQYVAGHDAHYITMLIISCPSQAAAQEPFGGQEEHKQSGQQR